ncbi:MAG: hypothetical protein IKJ14_02530 [Clostridia bacterium]|nr:hypothetical protein [Clostridia bacterium]
MVNISEKLIQYLKKQKDKGVVTLTGYEEKESDDNTANKDREAFKTELLKLKAELEGAGADVKLQKMEYTPLTEEEINKKATSAVDEKYALKKNALTDSYENDLKQTEQKAKDIKENSQVKKQELDGLYSALEEKLSNNAVKRGISRSSIIAEQIKNLGLEKVKDVLNIDNETASAIEKNAQMIDELTDKYQKAVSNLDLEKAIEINENIEKIKKEQESKLEEVLKYNNLVTRQGAELKQEVGEPSKLEISKIKSQMIKQAVDYYSKLPKESRLEAFLADEEILELLGEDSYVIGNYIKTLP